MRFRIFVKGAPLSTFIKGMPAFLRDLYQLKKQAATSDEFPLRGFYPCVRERYMDSGTAGGHYFHQDLLVASRIFKNNPERHVDIGSRIDGLVAHVASFRPIEVLDIRSLKSPSESIIFTQADLMDVDFSLVNYCDSVSCLHVLEHFGLGRYGDQIDFLGHLKGWKNIYRMLRKNGILYFSVPIGEQRIEFNAHRVFSINYLLEMMEGRYHVKSFSYVDDAGDLVRDPEMTSERLKSNFSCQYGCGIFELVKL